MLICVNFTKSDIDLGSIYKILDTDDYTKEIIAWGKLKNELLLGRLKVDNILFVEEKKLFRVVGDNMLSFDDDYYSFLDELLVFRVQDKVYYWFKGTLYTTDNISLNVVLGVFYTTSYVYKKGNEWNILLGNAYGTTVEVVIGDDLFIHIDKKYLVSLAKSTPYVKDIITSYKDYIKCKKCSKNEIYKKLLFKE